MTAGTANADGKCTGAWNDEIIYFRGNDMHSRLMAMIFYQLDIIRHYVSVNIFEIIMISITSRCIFCEHTR